MFVISEMDIDHLDIVALRALDALLAERNVTRAADRLGVSQPAMSAQLRRLRKIFDDPILTRVPGGSTPTARALDLAGPVADVLQRIRALGEAIEAKPTSAALSGRICIVATDYVAHLVLPRLMRHLRASAPDLRVEVRFADRTRVRESMEHGDVDLGFGTGQAPTGRLHFRTLFTDRAVCILGREHHAESRQISLARFCALAHIRVVPRRPSYYDERVDELLRARHLRRSIALTLQDFLAVPAIVKATPLTAIVASRLLKLTGVDGLIAVPPPIDLGEMPIGMYWHARTNRSPLHQWFRGQAVVALRGLK